MPASKRSTRVRKALIYTISFLAVVALLFSIFVNRFVEPALRDRLHTLIIQGSDSLYTYELGALQANVFGGNVEVRNLHIQIDSNRYRKLAAAFALPSLTMELDLVRGQIRGLGVFPLLLGKRIAISQIISKDANIRLLRHVRHNDAPKNRMPLWKMVQPAISSITVDRINLDGVKLLYRNADTSDAIKLQFDRCIGLFDDIRIDSASAEDTSRIGFTKHINLQFNGLKFRTPDSSYKMKADVVSYSSRTKVFEVVDFKIQPTLKERADFYRNATHQQTMYVIEYGKLKLTNIRLDRFIDNNIIAADTVFLERPVVDMYSDKTLPPVYESKIGTYPHQKLLKASSTIMVKTLVVNDANLSYTEKNGKTGQEGTLNLKQLDLQAVNVTNDSNGIKRNRECVLYANGKILDNSPFRMEFRFYLDSTDGKFKTTGEVRNVSANQLNKLAEPLSNVRLRSLDLDRLNYTIEGNDFAATSDVTMWYNNLFIVLEKQDEETGAIKTKKFMTKLLNKFTLYDSNPGPNGVLRQATGAQRSRISSQSFFGLIWKSLFTGMQDVMMKSGRYE
jgi:hypothetical protein